MIEFVAIVFIFTGWILSMLGGLNFYASVFRGGYLWFTVCFLTMGIGFFVYMIIYPERVWKPWLQIVGGWIVMFLPSVYFPDLYY